MVEKFNDHWRQKFLGRVYMESEQDLQRESLAFEDRHNRRYRYSKLGGKTPVESLAAMNVPLRFPATETPPKLPLPKPKSGRYHIVRFIRGDGKFNLFGEWFLVPSQAIYEYVRATVDVGRQRLYFRLDGNLLDEQQYRLR